MGAGARYGLPEEPHASDDGAQVPGSRGRPADGAHLARREHGLPAPAVGLFLEHKDALNAALMLIDARSLACLSLVSRTWYALAGDDRLWEPHCRADPICAKMIIPDMVESGGWRRFYATRAKEERLRHLISDSRLLTFADIWLTTGEILWENVVGSIIPLGERSSKPEVLWRQHHKSEAERLRRQAATLRLQA